ncbi:MAG: ABC transporter ATP-binding protein [Oscillospiraceae bacterium]|nr:ABC transporter ATP-binding protein [Oscillospiraceae bacterium]MBR7010226.1 ABC transporter ATP-binding protein [Oscillospiraceae bacterium]
MEQKSLFAKLKMIFPRKERRYFVVLFFLILIGTAFDFLGVSLILPLVNLLVSPAQLEERSWYRLLTRFLPIQDPNTLLLVLVLVILAVYIVKNLYAIYMSVVQGVFLARNRINTSAKLLDCYLRKPYTFHLQHNSAELIRSINSDVGSAYEIVSSIISLITNGLVSLMLVGYLLLVDPWMTAAIVAGLALYSVLYFLIVRRKLKAAGEESREITVRMIKAIVQAVGGVKEVKLMGRERFFVDSYADNGKDFVRIRRRMAILSSVPRHLVEILCIGGILGLVAFKIALRQDLSAVVGSLSAFAVAAIKLMPSANSINSTINGISYRIPALNAVCEIIDDNWGADIGRAALDTRNREGKQEKLRADIQVEQLSFTYPERDEPVLRDVNLTVRAGTSVGIVGVTGAGKTTLVDVILGLLEPQQGRILYGGRDIRENYADWQARIGYIPQNIYLTDDTIRANVALGVYADKIDDEKVWKALDDAQLGDFVRSLKDGLDARIGEMGARISGGQRQRIGIARALYYDPDVLFLDEATAALDTATEKAVMAAVNALSREKTCIIIAHRLSTIENCDEIYEVRDGRVTKQTKQ